MDKMRVRDARESDLPEIVEIYNSTIPSRMVSADTEPATVEQRRGWFREHDPSRRPLWVAEADGRVIGWLSLGDFWDGRPTYHATAEVGIYVKDGYRGGRGRPEADRGGHRTRARARDRDHDRRGLRPQRAEREAV